MAGWKDGGKKDDTWHWTRGTPLTASSSRAVLTSGWVVSLSRVRALASVARRSGIDTNGSPRTLGAKTGGATIEMLLPILLVAAAPVAPEAADGVVFPPITNATDPWYAGTVISCPR